MKRLIWSLCLLALVAGPVSAKYASQSQQISETSEEGQNVKAAADLVRVTEGSVLGDGPPRARPSPSRVTEGSVLGDGPPPRTPQSVRIRPKPN